MKVRQLAFSLVLIMQGSALYGASFDCGRAHTSVEKTICRTPELSGLDAKMDDVYKRALEAADLSAQAKLVGQQREWIRTVRNNYGDAAFMAIAYEARIDQLLHPTPPTSGDTQKRLANVLDFKGLRIGDHLDEAQARLVFKDFACHDPELSKLMSSIEKQPVAMCRGNVVFEGQPMDALIELHQEHLFSVLLTYDTPYPEGDINSMPVADLEGHLIAKYGRPDILRTESPRQPMQYPAKSGISNDANLGGDSWAFANGTSVVLEPGAGHQNEQNGHVFSSESLWFTSGRGGVEVTIPAGHAISVNLTKVSPDAFDLSSGKREGPLTVQLYPDGKRTCNVGTLVPSVAGAQVAPASTTITCTEFVQLADSATNLMPPTIVYIFDGGTEVARGYIQLAATKESLERQ